MLVALEAAGSGTSYGTLDISAILIDFTSCFVDLQQLIFKQANSTPPKIPKTSKQNRACMFFYGAWHAQVKFASLQAMEDLSSQTST